MHRPTCAVVALAALFHAACAPAIDRDADDARSIVGTWIARDLEGASGAPRLVIEASGEASGYGGCNGYSSSYTRGHEDVVRFGAIAASKKACRGGAMASERRLFAALADTRSATVGRDVLTLRDQDGTALLVFERDDAAR